MTGKTKENIILKKARKATITTIKSLISKKVCPLPIMSKEKRDTKKLRGFAPLGKTCILLLLVLIK